MVVRDRIGRRWRGEKKSAGGREGWWDDGLLLHIHIYIFHFTFSLSQWVVVVVVVVINYFKDKCGEKGVNYIRHMNTM